MSNLKTYCKPHNFCGTFNFAKMNVWEILSRREFYISYIRVLHKDAKLNFFGYKIKGVYSIGRVDWLNSLSVELSLSLCHGYQHSV